MKRPCLRARVYNSIYPSPTTDDPRDWAEFVTKHIVTEVRHETVRFYGVFPAEEARWPGLDYSSRAARLRLSAFPHHRALFEAFDRLGLTSSEIYDLCKWEGTKYAKDRRNATHQDQVRDTTWDCIKEDDRPRAMPEGRRHSSHTRKSESRRSPSHTNNPCAIASAKDPLEPTTNNLEDDEDQIVEHSVGNSLNERLRAATAARLQGENVPLDPAYEQWLKDARERGALDSPATLRTRRSRHIYGSPGHYQYSNSPNTSWNASPFSSIPYSTTSSTRHPPIASSSSSSHYWTSTVPEIFQYETQNVYQTPALQHIAAATAYQPMHVSARYQFAPAYMPTTRRTSTSRRNRRDNSGTRQ